MKNKAMGNFNLSQSSVHSQCSLQTVFWTFVLAQVFCITISRQASAQVHVLFQMQDLTQINLADGNLKIASPMGVNNPLIRSCRQAGGFFWVYQSRFAGGGMNSDYAMCRFGLASLGAFEWINLLENRYSLQSIQLFLASEKPNNALATCHANGGDLREVIDSESNTASLCVFSDGSMLDMSTLSRGTLDAQNADLRSALLRFR